MDPISSGGNTEKTKPTITEISQRLDAIDVSDSDKLSKELAGLTDDMNAEIRDAFADGSVDKDESTRLDLIMSNLCRFNGRIKMAMRNTAEEVKNTYEQLSANVSTLIERMTTAMNGKDPDQVALEPGESDAQQLAALDKKATKLLDQNLKTNQERIDSEQNWCTHHGQMYIGDTVARPDKSTLDNIKRIYQAVSSDGYGNRILTFASLSKAQQLVDWSNKQEKLGKINSKEYDYLTKEAREYITNNSPRNQIYSGEVSDWEGDSATDEPPKPQQQTYYDSANDGHDAAWEAAGIKKRS